MKQITFRQLQTNTEWIKDLPVVVMRYGKPVVKIIEFDEKHAVVVEEVTAKQLKEVIDSGIEVKKISNFGIKKTKSNVTEENKSVKIYDVTLCPCGVPKTVCKKHMFSKG